jgi:hypothetical protein
MGGVTGVKDYPVSPTKDLRRDSWRLFKLRIRLSDEWGASERSSLRSRRLFVSIVGEDEGIGDGSWGSVCVWS